MFGIAQSIRGFEGKMETRKNAISAMLRELNGKVAGIFIGLTNLVNIPGKFLTGRVFAPSVTVNMKRLYLFRNIEYGEVWTTKRLVKQGCHRGEGEGVDMNEPMKSLSMNCTPQGTRI